MLLTYNHYFKHSNICVCVFQLWRTGIHVNPRHDPDTPPGIEVNATMYYILSTFPSPDYDINGNPKDIDEFESLLHAPEHCFGGPPTM